MKTRQDYLDGKISHRDYYAQFITATMVQQVIDNIGIERIKNSKDEHLSDIPMKEWDALSGHGWRISGGQEVMTGRIQYSVTFRDLCKQANEGISSSTMICVYKEIARQLVEGKLQ